MSRRTLARPEQPQHAPVGLPATRGNLCGSMGPLLLTSAEVGPVKASDPVRVGPERLMRLPEVARATGFSTRYIEAAWRKGTFPMPVQIGARAIAWIGSEVDEWIRTRPRVRPGVGQKSAGAS